MYEIAVNDAMYKIKAKTHPSIFHSYFLRPSYSYPINFTGSTHTLKIVNLEYQLVDYSSGINF